MGDVSDYIDGLDEPEKSVIAAIRDRVLELVPDATEGRSYGMPAILYRGKPLISVVRTKTHLALYPYSGEIVSVLAPRLDGYSLSKGTIRFSVAHPLPNDVLPSVVALRTSAIDASLDA